MNNSLKVKTYEEALEAFKKDGMRAEHNLRGKRNRAMLIVGGLLALYVVIGVIALSMGSSFAKVLQVVGIVIPGTSPFLAYGILTFIDVSKKIKLSKKYQDGSRFDGMTKEEVIDLWNNNLKK